ncbi:MAG: Holliday junction resolvase RuvX [Verrucomicrobia bacterium]|nr:Holliday junction resolvase RuvX [Verrucomicrobiota bacterium]MBS0637318.1 Holliday junction resolvase RuvX [Verrucomicrobiota bacterium]
MLKGRILGVDFGLKRIGLSVSDPLFIIASSLDTLQAGHTVKSSAELLAKHIQTFSYPIIEIVVGLPLHMNGTESERSALARQFAEFLHQASGIKVSLLDERLTTVQADRALIETGYSRKKRAQVVDRVSAVLLLQTFLSRRSPS